MKYMNRIFFVLVLILSSALSFAQTTSELMARRYDLIVSKVGPAGLGVETVLNAWEKADSTNLDMLLGRFRYCLTRAQSTNVVAKQEKKYLGMDPILSLKDTLGREVYYFQEVSYDDELFGKAAKILDKAVSLYPDRLDLRVIKANVYIDYEKGSPDLALNYLVALADEGAARKKDWDFEKKKEGKEFFKAAMQEYCYKLFSIGTPSSREAFFKLSEHLNKLFPEEVDFLNNIGSYHLVSKDYKSALKCYSKVLKKHPEDLTAIQNCVLAARLMKNSKMERKYLNMMAKYAPEKDALVAKARIEALNRK